MVCPSSVVLVIVLVLVIDPPDFSERGSVVAFVQVLQQ
jgi:hypothetical protein